MNIIAIKTHKITTKDTAMLPLLDTYVTSFFEKSILIIASKIIAITQGRVVTVTDEEKTALIKKECDYYLSPEENAYHLFITTKNNHLTYSAGMDESNADGKVVLFPKDAQKQANSIREYLCKRFGIVYAGVIITDMAAIPLQRGVIAGPIAYSGFAPLRDLTNTPDLFGRPFKHTKQGVLQGLAAAGGVVMGEGAEQTPLAMICDASFIHFQKRNPTKEELKSLRVTPEEDLFGSMIQAVSWEKGGS
jgi:dihydrofolate synthase / folylpolyglutamate synthase